MLQNLKTFFYFFYSPNSFWCRINFWSWHVKRIILIWINLWNRLRFWHNDWFGENFWLGRFQITFHTSNFILALSLSSIIALNISVNVWYDNFDSFIITRGRSSGNTSAVSNKSFHSVGDNR